MSYATSTMTALTRHSVAPTTHACTRINACTEKRAKKTTAITISNVTRGVVMTISVLISSIATRAVGKTLIAIRLQHRIAAVKASALMTSSVKEIRSMATIVTVPQNVLQDTVIRRVILALRVKRYGHHGMFSLKSEWCFRY